MRSPIALLLLLSTPILARQDPQTCGTTPLTAREQLYLHRRHQTRRLATARPADTAPVRSTNRDLGNLAIIEDSGGVVGRRNPFDLNERTLAFLPQDPAASNYRYELTGPAYDQTAADTGTLIPLGDDDSAAVGLPFPFPYFGNTYTQIFVNSDGNLTFLQGDSASADRSLGRFTAGQPRIAPLYADLDPTHSPKGVYVTPYADRLVITWVQVPVYSSTGQGPQQTFQTRLYSTGRIETSWSVANLTDAVVGISPGGFRGDPAVVSFTTPSTQSYPNAVADRFSGTDAIDIVTSSQRFYETHGDAYDYLVFFNSEGISAGPSTVAYEVTVRNSRTGYGDTQANDGAQYGSPRRLQAVLNMGPLSQYPSDPNAVVPLRSITGDTALTVLGHETGHLFLAFASILDANGGQPMLGRSLVHWSFLFNSEASLLEGNRIQDNGPGVSGRFTTVATVQGYSPLDQYLMGFRDPTDVPPTFLVANSPQIFDPSRAPQKGVTFSGDRRDIDVHEVIDQVGPRIPDFTVAQRRFRFGFVLIVPAGAQPDPSAVAQLETYRAAFESAYARFADGRATADASLQQAVQLSIAPAAGVPTNFTGTASLRIDQPATAPLTFSLQTDAGLTTATIPTGATSVQFPIAGVQAGIDHLLATPDNPAFEVTAANIQTAEPASLILLLETVDNQTGPSPIQFRLTDRNNLPYPGITLDLSLTGGGAAIGSTTTDESGRIGLLWTPGATAGTLTVSLPGGPSSVARINPAP